MNDDFGKFEERMEENVENSILDDISTVPYITETDTMRALVPGKNKKTIRAPKVDTAEDKIKETVLKNARSLLASSEIEKSTRDYFKALVAAVTENQAAKNFVGIQPMQGPVGLIYTLEYKEEEIKNSGEKRLTLNVQSVAVEAGSRKLNTIITPEALEDMNSNSGTSNKLFKTLTKDISKEIYEEIRHDIIENSNKLSIKVEKENMIGEISIAINACAIEIARKTRRGAGNFVITSGIITNILKTDMGIEPSCVDQQYGYLEYVGTLNGTMKVYHDHSIEHDTIIVGYKGGNGETDTGYFYCPYMPIMPTGVAVDPVNFNTTMRMFTRYAKHVVRKTDEETSKDGSTTTITREPCNYYTTIKLELPKINFDDNKEVKVVHNNVLELDAVGYENIFDSAMKLLD